MDPYVLLAGAAAGTAEDYLFMGADGAKVELSNRNTQRFFIARAITGAGVGFGMTKLLPMLPLPDILAQNGLATVAAATFVFYRFLPMSWKLHVMNIENNIATDMIAKVY
jgi:hypothetical protein